MDWIMLSFIITWLITVFMIGGILCSLLYITSVLSEERSYSRKGRKIVVTDPTSYKNIKAGLKTVELRVCEPDRYNDYVGESIEFRSEDREPFTAKLVKVTHYANLVDCVRDNDVISKLSSKPIDGLLAYNMHIHIRNKSGKYVFKPDRVKNLGGVTALHVQVPKK